MNILQPARSWTVLLIGGASGVGKTSVSYRLAHHFGVGITEVDDFQVILEKMTTPEQQPVLHYWNTHLSVQAEPLSARQVVDHAIAVSQVLAPALEAVIANHLESAAPVVLEGDFILPSLAAQKFYGDAVNEGSVRGVFIDEPDEPQLIANFMKREPERGVQAMRAQVSRLYGEWLKAQAVQFGIDVIPARPWDTVFDRLVACVTR